MRKRMVRFQNLEGSAEGSVDSGIPGYERKIFNVMGFEAPEAEEIGEKIVASPVGQVNARGSAIPHPAGFSLAYVECEPGNGVIYHTHDTNETFIPVTGRWRVYWGEDESVELEPRDVISFPGPVPRRFLNIGEESGLMLAIVAGDSPRIFVDPEALERTRQTGLGRPVRSATATSTT